MNEMSETRKRAIDFMKGIPICVNCISFDDECGWCFANPPAIGKQREIKLNSNKQIIQCNYFKRHILRKFHKNS